MSGFGLDPIAWTLIGLYALFIVGKGIWWARQHRGALDYFLAGRTAAQGDFSSLLAGQTLGEGLLVWTGQRFRRESEELKKVRWLASYLVLAVALLIPTAALVIAYWKPN